MATATVPQETRPSQNWIVGPWTDWMFIIAAPVVALVWSVIIYLLFGAAMVWAVFMVFNIAHHFPTFIRIYGDKECMKRFRWSLILGPVIPFCIAMTVASFIITDPNGNLENLAFLWIILTIWDPWHFLMQHYGFMRIYDRHNHAPRKLASWMDYLISTTWFVFIMMAVVQWFMGDLLYNLYNNHGIPLLLWVSPQFYRTMVNVAFGAASIMSMVYIGYIFWCRAKGYYISYAKLLLLLITFAVMYVTYMPNSLMRGFFPDWSFTLGFATLGMVHVTQYLAIVWTYNRSLARKGPKRSRPGLFTSSFAKGGLAIAGVYVAICLAYGATLSPDVAPIFHTARMLSVDGDALELVFALMWSVGFTSTFTHYYFDGFIWKVRHKENRENLSAEGQSATTTPESEAANPTVSWWDRGRGDSPGATFFRQMIYFGIPFGLMIMTYVSVASTPRKMPLSNIQQAFMYKEAGHRVASIDLAERAIAAAKEQEQVEGTLAQVSSGRRVNHETYVADLIYWSARAKMDIVVSQKGKPTAEDWAAYDADLERSISLLSQVLESTTKDDFQHRERPIRTREEVESDLKEMRHTLEESRNKRQTVVS